jgi:ketosteroid isomerase-like protein
MSTRAVVQDYFRALELGESWQAFLAEDLAFTILSSPVKRVSGRAAYLEATRRFYSMIRSVHLRELIIEGERACALTHYELEGPDGKRFESDVVEILTVSRNQITSLEICFDPAPYPKR